LKDRAPLAGNCVCSRPITLGDDRAAFCDGRAPPVLMLVTPIEFHYDFARPRVFLRRCNSNNHGHHRPLHGGPRAGQDTFGMVTLIRTAPSARALGSTSLRRFLAGSPSFSQVRRGCVLSRCSASAVSNRLGGTDFSDWASGCWSITHWYRDG